MFLTKVGFNRDSNSNYSDLWIRIKRNISIFYIRHGVNNAEQLNVIDILKNHMVTKKVCVDIRTNVTSSNHYDKFLTTRAIIRGCNITRASPDFRIGRFACLELFK